MALTATLMACYLCRHRKEHAKSTALDSNEVQKHARRIGRELANYYIQYIFKSMIGKYASLFKNWWDRIIHGIVYYVVNYIHGWLIVVNMCQQAKWTDALKIYIWQELLCSIVGIWWYMERNQCLDSNNYFLITKRSNQTVHLSDDAFAQVTKEK